MINSGTPDGMAHSATAFRNALREAGYVEGQNVIVEYHWLAGDYDRAPPLIADLVRRRVAVIVPRLHAGSARSQSGDRDDPDCLRHG